MADDVITAGVLIGMTVPMVAVDGAKLAVASVDRTFY